MVRKALGTFCPAVSLIQTWHDMPPFPPASPGKWVAMGSAPTLLAPYTSGYKLALLVNYSIMLCKCFLTNYTFLGLKLHFARFPFHCTSPRSDPSTPIALEININGFRCLLLWYGPLFGQSPWTLPLALPLCLFFFKLWWQCAMGAKCWLYVQKWHRCYIKLQKQIRIILSYFGIWTTFPFLHMQLSDLFGIVKSCFWCNENLI